MNLHIKEYLENKDNFVVTELSEVLSWSESKAEAELGNTYHAVVQELEENE